MSFVFYISNIFMLLWEISDVENSAYQRIDNLSIGLSINNFIITIKHQLSDSLQFIYHKCIIVNTAIHISTTHYKTLVNH